MVNKPAVKKQKGVALVMAIMIVALVTTIAVEMSWRFDLSIARTANRWKFVQAENYLDAVDVFAKTVLLDDFEQNKEDKEEFDALSEDWATVMPPVPVDHGMVMGKMIDAQGLFNMNLMAENIWKVSNTNPLNNFTENQKRFIRLLQTINLSQEEDKEEYPLYLSEYESIEIAEAVIDWMDSNGEYDPITGTGGAEADYYAQLEPPVTIANRPMISISELRVIKGITPLLYERLLPFVIALQPQDQNTAVTELKLNVNTMPLELIRALNTKDTFEPLSIEDGKKIHDAASAGFKTLEEFWDAGAVNSVWPSRPGSNGSNSGGGNTGAARNFDDAALAVRSNYFIVSAMTEVGEEVYRGKTLLYRDPQSGQTKTLRKTKTNF